MYKPLTFLKTRRSLNEQVDLQITSMADIFTILLVFLLKSYSTTLVNVSVASDVTLPHAVTGKNPVETLRIEISARNIQVEGRPVASLQNFSLTSEDLDASGASKSLSKELARERTRQNLTVSKNPQVKPDARLLVIADKHAPYAIIRTALRSAAANGYTDYKLVVVGVN